MRTLLRRLSYLMRRRQIDADVSEELEIHRAMVREQLERSGLSPEDAAAASARTLGNVALAREDARDVWGWPLLERIWQDLRYGMRSLRKQPTFSATAILTLAVGIGATTTVVSVVEAELWRPLPFPAPDRLTAIYTSAPKTPTAWEGISGPELRRWRAESQVFDDVAAFASIQRRVLRGREVPELVRTREVTSSFFATLGWSPALGRSFGAEDDGGSRARSRIAAAPPAVPWRSVAAGTRS
jgi:hypothetical protein